MPLTRLVYASRRQDGGDADLAAILRTSEARNAEAGLTGALIAGERHFLQLLEGRRADLGRCLARIARDPRHGDLQVISAAEARQRLFPDWSMRVVDQSLVLRLLLRRLGPSGAFSPPHMSQAVVQDLFRRLAVEARVTTQVPARPLHPASPRAAP